MLGGIMGRGFGYHDKAIAAYRRSLELNLNFLIALGNLGTVLALAGRAEESIRKFGDMHQAEPARTGHSASQSTDVDAGNHELRGHAVVLNPTKLRHVQMNGC
jgi:tetratricopeptide (TPR) repeat protein